MGDIYILQINCSYMLEIYIYNNSIACWGNLHLNFMYVYTHTASMHACMHSIFCTFMHARSESIPFLLHLYLSSSNLQYYDEIYRCILVNCGIIITS